MRDPAARTAARAALFRENPFLAQAVGRVGGFGNAFSAPIANHMYSRDFAPALADARDKLTVDRHGEGTWLLRFPWVNVAVFETRAGLVLVDAGYAPAGPALRDALRTISRKRVHTIIYTHHHIDHVAGNAVFQGGRYAENIAAIRSSAEAARS